jgi:diacylglycerol O-acyltransferase
LAEHKTQRSRGPSFVRAVTTLERMNPMDAWFLYAEEDGVNHMNILSFVVLEGSPPPYDDLLALVERKLPRLPRYRQVVRSLPLQVARPVWVDDANFDLQFHVRQTALAAPGDDTVLERLISRLMAQQFDRARPLWELWCVEALEGGRWALLSKLHHAMVDGVSGADMVSILLDREPQPEPLPVVPWEPRPAPSTVEILGDTMRGVSTSPAALARSVWAAAQAPRSVASTAVAALTAGRRATRGGSASALNGPIGPSRRYTWTSYSLDDVKRVRKVIGGTVNDIVAATATRGFRDLLLSRGEDVEGRTVRVIIPIALHARDAKGTAVAAGLYENRITGVFADLPVGEPDPLERARMIREQLAALKASREGAAGDALTRLSGFAPATFLALGQRAAAQMQQGTINSVVSNVPGPQVPMYALGRKVLAAYPSPPIFPVGARMAVACFSYNGGLHFGLIADYSTVPDIHVLRDGIKDGLEELLEATVAAP